MLSFVVYVLNLRATTVFYQPYRVLRAIGPFPLAANGRELHFVRFTPPAVVTHAAPDESKNALRVE